MNQEVKIRDAIVIGGGFYGAAIAAYLSRHRGLGDVLLVEQEDSLLSRASFNNQARVHNGYHYPRSFKTAYRSRINLPRFVRDWPTAINQDFTKIYAIARRNSKITAHQFKRFCKEIGASIENARPSFRALFEQRLVEDVFEVQEYAFNSTKLATWAMDELLTCNVEMRFKTRVTAIVSNDPKHTSVTMQKDDAVQSVVSRYVFNCTYSGINQIAGDFPGVSSPLKHEITEMALVNVPSQLAGLGITVMDGPFFSLMPFPARGLHTLSHVRYTPHSHWRDISGLDPYKKLADYSRTTRVDRMLRDTSRYLPAVAQSIHVDSLFEVKTVLEKNEGDDGRPILFERHTSLPGCFSVLGGKIDNIYDVLEKLENETF